ncbi:MAG: AAA family ATPase [Candidatus Dormibacteraeota bacterium]|nr:AAA family ATPase [Candidatus Dormibacteraeota bacterium]
MGSAKSTRAQQIEEERRALRLTPDEWMIPLFNDKDTNRKRNVLEGRFIWLALLGLRHAIDVVLDFRALGTDDRTGLRALAAAVGGSSKRVDLEIYEDQQRRGLDRRALEEPETTCYITDLDLDEYRRRFVPLDDAELSTAVLDPPPAGHTSWRSWASALWPTSRQ